MRWPVVLFARALIGFAAVRGARVVAKRELNSESNDRVVCLPAAVLCEAELNGTKCEAFALLAKRVPLGCARIVVIPRIVAERRLVLLPDLLAKEGLNGERGAVRLGSVGSGLD